jgi:hypothetical protein
VMIGKEEEDFDLNENDFSSKITCLDKIILLKLPSFLPAL